MATLTTRERMLRTYKRQEIDRVPMYDQAWRGTQRRWKKEGMEEFPSFPHSMELSSRSLDPLTEVAQTLLVVSDSLQSH